MGRYYYYSSEEIKVLREKAIEFFGGKCMNPNCLVPGGCKDSRCLQIDHIQAAGKNRLIGADLYFDILENPYARTIYQLLCANCNWIKRHEKNETRGNVTDPIQEWQKPLNPVIAHITVEPAAEPCYKNLASIEEKILKEKERSQI